MSIHQQLIRIREESKQQMRPRDFWLMVGAATLLLGTMGVYFLQTGRVPMIPTWLWLGLLLLVWGGVLVNILRYGHRVYSAGQIVSLFCFSLFAISQMVPLLHKSSWTQNASLLILVIGNFWSLGDTRNQPASMPPVNPPMRFTS